MFFEHNQIFWSWSKARFYLINLHIWALELKILQLGSDSSLPSAIKTQIDFCFCEISIVWLTAFWEQSQIELILSKLLTSEIIILLINQRYDVRSVKTFFLETPLPKKTNEILDKIFRSLFGQWNFKKI